ncbi:Alpha/Beta hydrolase protein [Aspergillus insuetus]
MADGPRYSTQGAYGLKKCHDSTSAVVDVVFIHGLTGNRETTWTDKETKVFWPGALLPNDIPDARILTFGYDADIVHFLSTASQNRIGNHAQNFINVLSQLREKSETIDRPIIFVAHSLGGLMALLSSKNSAEGHLQHIVECTVGITFLGTPHCGSDLANWAKVFGRVITMFKRTNTRLLETLSPDSEVLAWIQKDFHTMLRSRQQEGKEPLKITCFYEELPIHGIGEIVPMHSAILPSYNSIGIHKNHMDMAKFFDEEDPGYLAVSTEIWRWVKDIKSQRQLIHSTEGPNMEALNRQQYCPQYPYAANPQSGQRALPPNTEAGIPTFEAYMAQFGRGFSQPEYSRPVFQGGNTISGHVDSRNGKVVQGNNIRADRDVTFQ